MAVGRRVAPDSWQAKTSGTARFTTDVRLPAMLTARILRSPHPHAEVRGIDTSRVAALEGVAAVITASDLPKRRYLHLGEPFSDRAALAQDRVRFIGEEVAAVAAESRAVADAALDLIDVDYSPLAAATTVEEAARNSATPIHDGPTNVALGIARTYGDPDAARAGADVVVEGSYRYGPAAHLCMEPHSVVASWDPTSQRMDLWVSTQAPYFVRKEVAHLLDLDIEQVHTHEVAVGGGFGAKAKAGLHETIAAALSMRAGRPVRLVLDRDEEFATTSIRHPFDIEMRTGARRNGMLTHRDCDLVVENGAYNHAGPSVAVYATMLAASLYRLEGSESTARLLYTNKQPAASFRGYGNPQITFAMESQLDELAAALDIDRVEIRVRNAHVAGDETLTGWRLATAGLVQCLERARDEIGWVEKQRLAGSGRGVGIAAAVHVSGANAFEHSEFSGAALDVSGDGTVHIQFAGADAGTGQATLLRQIAAEELGVPFEDTTVTMMESDGTPMDLGAWSSRGTVWGGHAMADTARVAASVLKEAAAEKFATTADQVRLVDGQARTRADAIDIGDLVPLTEGGASGRLHVEGGYLTDVEKMDKVAGRSHFSPSYAFAVQAVEVEVDPDTGEVRVVEVVSVHDSGAVLNPASAEGQVVGAVAMGLGAALGEELIYTGGRLVDPSFLGYAAPRASDLPPVRVILLDGHDPAGPYGAKGLGEIGLVPTPAAVANAVAHATGVRVRELPITPDKLLPHLRAPTRPVARWRRPARWHVAAVRSLYPRGLFRAMERWGTRFAPHIDRTGVETLDRPSDISEAVALHDGDGSYIAGGTDLLVAREQGIVAPRRLIDVTAIEELAAVEIADGGGLLIGAGVTLERLRRVAGNAGDALLEKLLGELATHQIREMATVGGNLLQANRCSYYRSGFPCYKRGGRTCPCYALAGDHRFHHAVVDAHRCQAVTPSDLATGLLALDAVVVLAGADGTRRVPIGALYAGPGESVLADGELLVSIEVPGTARRRHGAFEKLRRYAGDFAMSSVAVSLELDGGVIRDARVALGAVAPVPYRATSTEALLIGSALSDTHALASAAHAWTIDADPLAGNAWKVDATTGLIRRALRALASMPAIS